MRDSRLIVTPLLLVLLVALAAGCKDKQQPETIPSEPEQPAAETPPEPQPVEPVETESVEDFKAQDVDVRELTPAMIEQWNRDGVLATVYFEFDSYDLTPDSRMALQRNVEFMRAKGPLAIRVEGHCDERGTIEYNLALGERRASAVRDYLVGLGVDATLVRIVSYGEEKPAAPGHDEEAWSRNRRAEFVIESQG